MRPHGRPRGLAYARSDAGTSASAASGTTNEFSSRVSSSLINSGQRRPGSTATAKTSCTAVSNRNSATTHPVASSTTQTPQVRSSSVSRSVIGMPLKTARLAHLRESHEGQAAGEVEPAGEARHLGDRLVSAGPRVDEPERPRPRLADPEPPAVPPRRVGHRQPPRDDLAAGHVQEDAAPGLVRPPAVRLIGLPQRRDVARAAVDHPQAVEVAAVGRLQGRDERRPPPGGEAGRAVERAEAGEAGVDHPQLLAGTPGHLVALDVAGDVAGAGQEAGVVAPRRVDPGRDGRDVDVLPDLDRRADGEPAAVEGQAHRGLEAPEVGVEVVPLVADHHQLAGLVGRHQQRGAELPQQAGEVRRVDGPQRLRLRRPGPGRIGVPERLRRPGPGRVGA